jgi:hypothetical protein
LDLEFWETVTVFYITYPLFGHPPTVWGHLKAPIKPSVKGTIPFVLWLSVSQKAKTDGDVRFTKLLQHFYFGSVMEFCWL